MMKYLFFLIIATTLCAQETDDEPEFSFTVHEYNHDQESFSYAAITGTIPISMETKETIANLFFIAYFKNDDNEDRPITFVFPGGPGGSGTLSSILTVGPRRILTADEGRSVLPPYKLIDNPQTLLADTDLVFVDPANCGYSQVFDEDYLDLFYSAEGDIESLSEFVYTFTDIFEKWNSPKYLAGGSYGTFRCCGLGLDLLKHGITVNGIILDGCAIDFSMIESERDQFLPDCLYIPTFAATAWYHGRLWPSKSLEEVIDYARRFAFDEYAPIMMQPSRLSSVEKEVFEQRFAKLIGLPVDTVKRYNCRIDEQTYKHEFFSPERIILGGLDTRQSSDISTLDPDSAFDLSYKDSLGMEPAFIYYLQKELETFQEDLYVGFKREAIHYWNFGTYDSMGLPNVFQRLRHTLVINPEMKVFIGSGYYDARTPFAATEYCFDHLDLPLSYRENLQFEYYEAGHGFIFDSPSLAKWKKDLAKFYAH